ncbi:MAG: AAA family ATPase [Enterococcus sp.]|nr:AAA family ATPase [Enterococcus sp.]
MKKKNVKIALDQINDGLKYVFFSSIRFSIEYSNGKYKLLSYGNSVLPGEVSLGERNIIALCYFFANIMENQELKDCYSGEYIIVIDDPISSFDQENKIGILSYLKYQLKRFLLGNISSKLLLMTHDLQAYYDAKKIMGEILATCKEMYPNTGKHKFCMKELIDQRIVDKKLDRQEYTELLHLIYEYAVSETTENDELVIGNVMRRVLEAFSTFQYRKPFEKISTDSGILEIIGQPYEKYFENLMYRLVLNGESHMEERVKTMQDYNFFEVISSEAKKKTAKDILCLIYLLNKKHFEAHFKEITEYESNISKWLEEIKEAC